MMSIKMNTTMFETSNITSELLATKRDTLYFTAEPSTTTAEQLPTTDREDFDNDPTFLYLHFVYLKFQQLAYVPVTSLGVLGNAMSLWVWQAETVYNPTVLMLKVLAVCDSAYLMAHLTTYILILSGHSNETSGGVLKSLNIVVILSQVCSLNTTLLSSVTRLLAVFKPTDFIAILSRPRVVSLCVAILVWSLLLTSLETAWYVCHMAGRECQNLFNVVDFYRTYYVFDLLAYCIPSLVLLVCNALTVWRVCRHSGAARSGCSSAAAGSAAGSVAAASAATTPSSSNQRRGDRLTRRLSVTMVMISLTSLLSYPVAVMVRLTLNPGQETSDVCDVTCYYVVVYSCGVLTLLNSSVNFLIYCVISTRFRELLGARVSGLCRGRGGICAGVCRA